MAKERPVDLDTFIVATYCLIDELMDELLPDGERLRKRGPARLLLDDREVLTIEIVGEFLGLDTDLGIFRHFRRHYAEWFPGLAKAHRTTFARQAANLWKVKEALWRELLGRVEHDTKISLVDSFCVPVCSFAKAPRHKSFAGVAAYGHDAMSRSVFYGLCGHLRVCWPGVIVEATLAPANAHDRWVAESDLLSGLGEGAFVVGDTNYSSPILTEDLRRRYGANLIAPQKSSLKRQRHPWPRWLTGVRRRIETVISQLVERYGMKRVRARDVWHLSSRFWRKILSHTCCVVLCQRAGISALRFSELVTH
jgi:hypothetical protein